MYQSFNRRKVFGIYFGKFSGNLSNGNGMEKIGYVLGCTQFI